MILLSKLSISEKHTYLLLLNLIVKNENFYNLQLQNKHL